MTKSYTNWTFKMILVHQTRNDELFFFFAVIYVNGSFKLIASVRFFSIYWVSWTKKNGRLFFNLNFFVFIIIDKNRSALWLLDAKTKLFSHKFFLRQLFFFLFKFIEKNLLEGVFIFIKPNSQYALECAERLCDNFFFRLTIRVMAIDLIKPWDLI